MCHTWYKRKHKLQPNWVAAYYPFARDNMRLSYLAPLKMIFVNRIFL